MITIPHLHDIIDELPQELHAELDARSRERSIEKDDTIYHQGDKPEEWFKIHSGAVKLCTYSASGRELIALELHEGDCFGEMGVIDGLPRVSNAVAVKPCTLRVWSRTDFVELGDKFPCFKDAVMRMLALRSRLAYCMLAETSGLSLRERLAIALCRLAYTIPGDPMEKDIPISQEGLGQMLGASRQTVNKELQQLASAQLISLNYGRIRVINLPDLEHRFGQLAGTDPITPTYAGTRNE